MGVVGKSNKQTFRIGDFIIKPDRNLLIKDGVSYTLEPRIMDVLCVIADQPREVISRDKLIALVWNVEYGADESLTRAISILRKTFRSAGETEDFIQTIPKRGYRLAKNVSLSIDDLPREGQELVKSGNANISPTDLLSKPVKRTGVILGVFVSLLLGALTVFAISMSRSNIPIGHSLAISEHGRSVAVLSFMDMSAEGNQGHFSDGMVEEILSQLTQIPDLRIVGRTSSFFYKGKNVDIREIGDALKVTYIIDGSVRKQGGRLRITIQFINTADGVQMWSKTYNGYADNILNLQEKISQDITSELIISLGITLEKIADIDL